MPKTLSSRKFNQDISGAKVTRNTTDFDSKKVKLINPWDSL